MNQLFVEFETFNSSLKVDMKKFWLLGVFGLFGLGGAQAFPIVGNEFITDQMVVQIAELTLLGGENATKKLPPSAEKQAMLDTRSLEVQQWLSSVGGDNWFRNYLKKFGRPAMAEEHAFATLLGVSAKKLGYYYIRPAFVSKEQVTLLSCNGPKLENSPTMKAFCALANWNASIAFKDLGALNEFRKLAGWFLVNQKNGRWEWAIDVPSRNQKAPWISCLSQSLGISVLLREYQLEQNEKYLFAARKALEWMKLPITQRGCAYSLKPSGVWYEEYPDANNPSHVLNGHMWALFGIWDYFRVTGDPKVKEMFEDGISSLLLQLPKYDVGYWSVYATTNRVDLVEGNYQQFIIEQLKVLFAITKKEQFMIFANKWEQSMNSDYGFVQLAAKEFLKSKKQ